MAGSADCVVIGGDPSGLLLGLVLARHGRSVTVVRRGGPDARPPAGISPFLSPSSLDVLAGLGLLDQILGHGRRVGEVLEDTGEGRCHTVHFSGAGRFGYALSVPLATLTSTLLDAIAAEPGAAVRHGLRVVGIDQDPKSVQVRLDDGSVLEGGLLVCGDGAASAVREHAGIGVDVVEFGRPVVIVRTAAPHGWPDRITVRHDGDALVASIPLARQRMIVQWIGDAAELARLRASADPAAEIGERLCHGLPELAGHLAETPAHWDDVLVVRHRVVRPRRWSCGRVVLVGDAAHGVHSFGGQGVDLGIQDVGVLASALEHQSDRSPAGRLGQYEAVRRPFVERFQRYQLGLPELTGSEVHKRAGRATYRPIAEVLRFGQPQATTCWQRVVANTPTST